MLDVLIAVLVVVLGFWSVFSLRDQPLTIQIYVVTVTIGTFYWYLIPGLVTVYAETLVLGPAETSYYLQASSPALRSTVLCYVLMMLPAMLALTRKSKRRSVGFIRYEEADNWNLLSWVSFGGSILFLGFSYFVSGVPIAAIISGDASAREFMTFTNRSASATQSLLALLSIIVSFLSLVCATRLVIAKKVGSFQFFLQSLATLNLFVATGTRATLLVFGFSCLIAFVVRGDIVGRIHKYKPKVSSYLLSFAALSTAALVSNLSLSARFRTDETQKNFLYNSLFVHNDMLREFNFAIQNKALIREDPINFLLTPLTFAMPSFLGFDKDLPKHLVDFNFLRADIDILNGEGNVFPGLLADFYLNFGDSYVIAISLFVGFLVLSFYAVSIRLRADYTGIAVFIALMANLSLSFRNMSGAIVILVAIALLICFSPSFKKRR